MSMIGRFREVHRDVRLGRGRWTWHLFMSIATCSDSGRWNWLGRVYWPKRDRIKTWWLNRV